MIMHRSSFVPGLLMLIIAASFLFVMKHKVHNLNRRLFSINNEILSERENLHILNAEIAYLTNPKRIEKLAKQHLNLQTPKREQVIDFEILAKIIHEKELASVKFEQELEE